MAISKRKKSHGTWETKNNPVRSLLRELHSAIPISHVWYLCAKCTHPIFLRGCCNVYPYGAFRLVMGGTPTVNHSFIDGFFMKVAPSSSDKGVAVSFKVMTSVMHKSRSVQPGLTSFSMSDAFSGIEGFWIVCQRQKKAAAMVLGFWVPTCGTSWSS